MHTWYIETWFPGGMKSRPWPEKLRFLKILRYVLMKITVKVGIDHAISEEIAATDGQLLLK